MGRRRKANEDLIGVIEAALQVGGFVPYGRSFDFVQGLEAVKSEVDEVLRCGQTARALQLYEMFLAGCYEKANEIDDSGGNLSMFFGELFVDWIHARQKAGCSAEDNVHSVRKWLDNDDFGFCYEIEDKVVQVLDKEGVSLFSRHFEKQFDDAFAPFSSQPPKFIYDYPPKVHRTANVLKRIYTARKCIRPYLALCEKVGVTPKDCQTIATLYRGRRRFDDALSWIDKGLALEQERNWGNQTAWGLLAAKQELLSALGRKGEALELAWTQFKKDPSEYGYEDLMKYVPKNARRQWHEKAMAATAGAPSSDYIALCAATREWRRLADRIERMSDPELQDISHYTTQKAARGLVKLRPDIAARIYCAMAMRIVNNRKSKYYRYALDHLRKAKKLYEGCGMADAWQAITDAIRNDHSRKTSFIGEFEQIIAGRKPQSPTTFQQRARQVWREQTS